MPCRRCRSRSPCWSPPSSGWPCLPAAAGRHRRPGHGGRGHRALRAAGPEPGRPVVYWFGGWTPREGIALGVAFAVDPVGAALATLAGVLGTAALAFSWRIFDAVRPPPRPRAGVPGRHRRVLPERRPVQHVRVLRAAQRGRLRPGRLPDQRSRFGAGRSTSPSPTRSGRSWCYRASPSSTAAPAPSTWPSSVRPWPPSRPTGSSWWRSCCSWSASSSRRRWCRSTSGWPTPTPWRRPRSGCCSPAWCPSSACTRSPASTGRCSPAPWPRSRACAPSCWPGRRPPPSSAGSCACSNTTWPGCWRTPP